MQLTPELGVLVLVVVATALMCVPYDVARSLTRGLMAALSNPSPSDPPDPGWADRARRAHANAIENLAVFAPLVIVCAVAGVSTPATGFAAKTYLVARLCHDAVYAAASPVVRTLAFLIGLVAMLTFATALLSRGLAW